MIRENVTVYKVCDGEKTIIEGTAAEISKKLNISVSRIYEACDRKQHLKGKCKIYRLYKVKNCFELEHVKTGAKFIGTASKLSKELYVTEDRIFSNCRYNTLLLNEFKVRWLGITKAVLYVDKLKKDEELGL